MNPFEKHKTCKHQEIEFIEEDKGGKWFRCTGCWAVFKEDAIVEQDATEGK